MIVVLDAAGAMVVSAAVVVLWTARRVWLFARARAAQSHADGHGGAAYQSTHAGS